MLEVLEHAFMQRALVSGAAISVVCSVVGIFLVLRRYSLFGDAVAHTSFGGIAAGLMIGIYPLWAAYIVSIVSALVITRIRTTLNMSGDASIAVLLSAGIATGLVIISVSDVYGADILGFVFGSILLVSADETLLILGLAATILVVVRLAYRQLVYSTFSEEQAKVSGVQVGLANYVLIIAAGVTVVTSIQLTGILLMSSLFVIPNVSAMMWGRGFRDTMMLSISFSVSATVSGILMSYWLDVAPSGMIVLVALSIFAVSACAKRMRHSTIRAWPSKPGARQTRTIG